MNIDFVELTDLPNSMQELAEKIGLEAVLKLVEVRGGRRVTVPKVASNESWLFRLVGENSCVQLCQIYGGENIEIPICNVAKQRANVAEFIHEGGSTTEAAKTFDMTLRGIRKMCAVLRRQGRI
jgi:hypothetical protein